MHTFPTQGLSPQPRRRVLAIEIGVNNINGLRQHEPADVAAKLHVLLAWLSVAHPRSRAIVLAPLPSRYPSYPELVRLYKQVAAAHPKVRGRACGWQGGARCGRVNGA